MQLLEISCRHGPQASRFAAGRLLPPWLWFSSEPYPRRGLILKISLPGRGQVAFQVGQRRKDQHRPGGQGHQGQGDAPLEAAQVRNPADEKGRGTSPTR